MNPRDQSKAFAILGGIILLGTLFLGYQFIVVPLNAYNAQIEQLQESNQTKAHEVAQILRDRDKLRLWRLLSLAGVENLPPPPRGAPRTPVDREHAVFLAKDQYGLYLHSQMKEHTGIRGDYPTSKAGDTKSVPQLLGNVPVYTPLLFTVRGKGKLADVVTLLHDLQTTPLLHRVRALSLKQAEGGKSSDLTIELTMEALIVNGAAQRGPNLIAAGHPQLALDMALVASRRAPTGMGTFPYQKLLAAAWLAKNRDYSTIAKRNIFEGEQPPPPPKPKMEKMEGGGKPPPPPPPKPRWTPDLISFLYLTDVTINGANGVPEANVFWRDTDKWVTLGLKSDNKWIPMLKCGEGTTVVWGHVLHMDTRGVTFRVEFKTATAAQRRIRDKKAIYEVAEEELSTLKVSKIKLPTQGKWKVYKVHKSYWDGNLVRDEVVRVGRNKVDFVVSRWELMKGRILGQAGDFVLIGLPDRYCSFWDEEEDGEDDEGVPRHPGYCFFPIGDRMPEALRTPLEDRQVKEIRASALLAP
jgi:hypothetical protein